ncbi:tetratricopeptide repeat protein [Engelhardtia mirabilis]|uniref:Ancillary SecYEG translocon subunit/Cell division coordinator CpoB TPR domain-containing protein n=1 Tax=Engelhardtia mirabilis TaxID=2528011 RepID=A0A518BM91_9BACT|nr:hypothetical protein Pla133_31880 [Planctomycetes bacterium Pla133]QDV02420.1 hypothetical protein Pla86_31870 [Planctomycetes bacterium Pla86]
MQLVGIFLGAFVLYNVLSVVPLIGGLVRASSLLGFLACFLIVSALAKRLVASREARTRDGASLADLRRVNTPHGRGKLGAALLARGRVRASIEPLEEARRGDPEAIEWPYRLGCARLASGSPQPAVAELRAVVERDEEYAYGGALMRLAEATLASGDPAGSLELLERVDRNHGPSPEAAYRRGRALVALGRSAEAKTAFASARQLADEAPKFQRSEARGWALKAWWAGLTTAGAARS